VWNCLRGSGLRVVLLHRYVMLMLQGLSSPDAIQLPTNHSRCVLMCTPTRKLHLWPHNGKQAVKYHTSWLASTHESC
jgi:hypothetical protein